MIFPEMLQAGLEAYIECRDRNLEDSDVVVAVFLAMQSVYQMRVMRDENETIH